MGNEKAYYVPVILEGRCYGDTSKHFMALETYVNNSSIESARARAAKSNYGYGGFVGKVTEIPQEDLWKHGHSLVVIAGSANKGGELINESFFNNENLAFSGGARLVGVGKFRIAKIEIIERVG